jgi:hypothetical protein
MGSMASASYTVLPRVVVLLLLQVLLADLPTQLQVIRACVKKISISILPPLPSFFFLLKTSPCPTSETCFLPISSSLSPSTSCFLPSGGIQQIQLGFCSLKREFKNSELQKRLGVQMITEESRLQSILAISVVSTKNASLRTIISLPL